MLSNQTIVFVKTSGIPIYGSVASSSGMITCVTCQDMSVLATFGVLLMLRVVIRSQSCFLLWFKITLVSSEKVSFCIPYPSVWLECQQVYLL